MNATLPTGLRGRMLALGLLLVALASLYSLLAVPLINLYAAKAAYIETRQALLGKLGELTREVPALRRRLSELRAATDSRKFTLEGASDAIASASLQGRIAELAATAGLTIGSTESLPSQVQGDYRRVGLKLVVNGPFDTLLKLLAQIEDTAPPLVVDNLQMHSFQRRPGATAVAALDASFEVYGFRAVERTSAVRQ